MELASDTLETLTIGEETYALDLLPDGTFSVEIASPGNTETTLWKFEGAAREHLYREAATSVIATVSGMCPPTGATGTGLNRRFIIEPDVTAAALLDLDGRYWVAVFDRHAYRGHAVDEFDDPYDAMQAYADALERIAENGDDIIRDVVLYRAAETIKDLRQARAGDATRAAFATPGTDRKALAARLHVSRNHLYAVAAGTQWTTLNPDN